MSIFSDILSIFGAIFKAIFNFIKKYIVLIIMVIIIVLVCIYAPELLAFLAESGAPEWMSVVVTGIADVGEVIEVDLGAVGSWLGSLFGAAWTAFSGAGIGTQAAIIAGIGIVLDPSGTEQLLSDIGSTVGSVVGSVVGSTVSALFGSSGGILIAVGIVAAVLLLKKKPQTDNIDVTTPASGAAPQGAS